MTNSEEEFENIFDLTLFRCKGLISSSVAIDMDSNEESDSDMRRLFAVIESSSLSRILNKILSSLSKMNRGNVKIPFQEEF